ncbi:hypothetical protein [Cryptosporangium phraense]|uniref:Uncharacterized protein n=1 Tax=Cryptosporangium phraense TaxID=2593070 RepID=A0A545AS60_9ACTN|nr:hypothetical protein [Cryptosporangium phraense]TQS44172.1 hypothetical protein FL583_14575 [Cryptosporangium phraense]
MSELIPLLWELVEQQANGNRRGMVAALPPPVAGWPGVPQDFVPSYVGLHNGTRTAQAHWEIVVARVLDTDIVSPNVSGELAIRRAVRASALLLNKMARHGRCPICPQPALTSSH